MDPMRYFRERAEAMAFARQGKELPKGQIGIPGGDQSDMSPNMDDATVALANKWDAMSLRDRYKYVTKNPVKYPEPYFPGQDPITTKRNVMQAWREATKG
jgi:hypothetical protein